MNFNSTKSKNIINLEYIQTEQYFMDMGFRSVKQNTINVKVCIYSCKLANSGSYTA